MVINVSMTKAGKKGEKSRKKVKFPGLQAGMEKFQGLQGRRVRARTRCKKREAESK